jgi:signal transduction histidine kinase
MARIAIEDDGVGMPPTAKRYGFGLLALRDRLEQLGGSLEISAAAKVGSTVVVSLPTAPHRPGTERVAR